MKVVLAIDSMKGCLSSREACAAAAEAIQSTVMGVETVCIPLGDGGEGTMDALHAQQVEVRAHGPLMDERKTCYSITFDTAWLEMANTGGLPLLPEEERNPRKTTSYGLGEQMKHALEQGIRNLVIGLGGSCTNDAGIGMLQALGFICYDHEGKPITEPLCGEKLKEIGRIGRPTLPSDLKITVACDVQNPLYGPEGAAYVFAPQKGARPADLPLLDEGLQWIGNLEGEYVPHPGDGAAGGLGYGLRHFLNAQLAPGIEIILDLLRFDERTKGADLIVTGEGRCDRQTLMGKVPYGVLRRGKKMHIPTLLIAGCVEDRETLLQAGFAGIYDINEGSTLALQECIQPEVAKRHIRQCVSEFAPIHLAITK